MQSVPIRKERDALYYPALMVRSVIAILLPGRKKA